VKFTLPVETTGPVGVDFAEEEELRLMTGDFVVVVVGSAENAEEEESLWLGVED
jgi:hypothetical protein